MTKDRKRAEQRRAHKRHDREVARRRKRAEQRAAQPEIVNLDQQHPMPPYLEQLIVERHFGHEWVERFPELARSDLVAMLPDDVLASAIAERCGRTVAELEASLEVAPQWLSAWGLAVDDWARYELSKLDEQHVGMLGVELWKRRRPERPCLEQLLEELDDASVACEAQPDERRLLRFADVMQFACDLTGDDEQGLYLGGEAGEFMARYVGPLARAAAAVGGAMGLNALDIALRWCERFPHGSKDHARLAMSLAEAAQRLGRDEIAARLRGDLASDLQAITRPC